MMLFIVFIGANPRNLRIPKASFRKSNSKRRLQSLLKSARGEIIVAAMRRLSPSVSE
jgi:hypothetical protein